MELCNNVSAVYKNTGSNSFATVTYSLAPQGSFKPRPSFQHVILLKPSSLPQKNCCTKDSQGGAKERGLFNSDLQTFFFFFLYETEV